MASKSVTLQSHLPKLAGLAIAADVGAPVLAFGAMLAFSDAAGIDIVLPTPFGIPFAASLAIFALLMPGLGLAHYLVRRHGHDGDAAAWTILALVASLIALPIMLAGAAPFLGSLVTMIVMLVALSAFLQTASVDKHAALLVAPVLAWTGIGGLMGLSVVAGGWSPPFALANGIQS